MRVNNATMDFRSQFGCRGPLKRLYKYFTVSQTAPRSALPLTCKAIWYCSGVGLSRVSGREEKTSHSLAKPYAAIDITNGTMIGGTREMMVDMRRRRLFEMAIQITPERCMTR